MKRTLLFITTLLVLTLASAPVFAQDNDRQALFQLGIGPGFPSYPSEMEAILSMMESDPAVDRLQLALDLGLGVAVSPKGFVMARIDGTGDRLDDGLDYIQINLYLYSLGFRYYPDTTGFYLEGNLGASVGVTQSSMFDTESSESGPGFGAALGYDFARKATGFGIVLEARYNFLTIEDYDYGQLMATVNLCWK